jgi:hypothetical protein
MLCTVNYNAASGSDTAASGSNAPVTALTDANTGATVTTAGSTSVTFSSTIDLTGVNNDGSDVIWINTTAGTRHLFRIVTFTGGVATCTGLVLAETASTSQSGLSWAIGGKRQTLKNDATQPDVVDWTDGWCAQFDPGTYLVGSWTLSGGSDEVGPILIKSTDGLTATPAIWDADGTVDMPELSAGLFRIEGMEFRGAAWRGGLEALQYASTSFYGNRFRSGGNNSTCLTINGSNYNPTVIENNEFVVGGSSGERGLVSGASRAAVYIRGNYFHGTNVLADIGGATTDSSMCVVEENLFVGNGTAAGVTWTGSNNMSLVVNSNIFYNCSTGAYIEKPSTGSVNGMRSVRNNIFEGCTTGVWTDADILATRAWAVDHNAFYNNTTDRTNVRVGDNDVSLTASPFVNAASDDFRLNALSGGGLECRGVVPRGPQFLASFTEDIGPFSTPISLLAANEVRPDALVGHWSASLDDDGAGTTTATDLSGNGNNGTYVNTPVEVADAEYNGLRRWDFEAYGTTANDRIVIPSNAMFDAGNGTTDSAISVGGWFKANLSNAIDNNVGFVGRHISSHDNGCWGLYWVSTLGALVLKVVDNSTNGYLNLVSNNLISSNSIPVNGWFHVMFTYDGSGSHEGLKLYLNGKEITSYYLRETVGTYVASESISVDVIIGDRNPGTSKINTSADDVRIYNVALSADEVQALAASRVGREAPRTTTVPSIQSQTDGIASYSVTDTFDVPFPTGIQSGDLLLVVTGRDDPSDSSILSNNAGLHLLVGTAEGEDFHIFAKICNGTESGNITFTMSAVDSEQVNYCAMRISNPGVYGAHGFIHAYQIRDGSRTNPPVKGYRGRVENCLWIALLMGRANIGTVTSGPTGWAQVYEAVGSYSYGALSIYQKTEAAHEQTGDSWTVTADASDWQTVVIAVAAQDNEVTIGGGSGGTHAFGFIG